MRHPKLAIKESTRKELADFGLLLFVCFLIVLYKINKA
jgi:hypothetical protein